MPFYEETSTEQAEYALRITDTALTSINTLLNVSMWALGILVVVLAIIGIFGWYSIRIAAIAAHTKMAKATLDTYIQGDKFDETIRETVREAVKVHWQNNAIVPNLTTSERSANEQQPFKDADAEHKPKGGGE